MTFVGQSLGVPWFRQEHGQGFMAPLGALLLLGLAATLAVWHWGGGRRGVRPIVWALTALLSGVCVAFGSRGLWGHAPFLTWEDWLLTGAAKRAGYAMSYLSPVAAALGLIGAAMLVAVTTRRGRQGALGAICVGLATALAGFGLVSAMGRVAGLPLVTSLGRPLSLGSGVAMSLLMLALALEGGLRRWLLIGFLGSEPGAVGRDQVVPRLLPVAAVRLLWIIAGLALAGSQLVLHNLGRGAWEDQEDLMSSVLDLTAERIANWRAERLGDARTLIRVPYLARALTELNTRPEAARQLTEFFREFRRAYGYATVDVYDRDLQPVLRLPAERRTERPAGVLEELRGAQDPVFHDLEADAEGGLRLGLAVPIRHAEGGDFAGAVYLGIDPAVSLFRILELWRGRSDSTDAVLVRKAGDGIEYLSPFRFQAVEKLPLRLDYSASGRLAVRLLQEGATDLIEGQDYRGVAVLGVGRPVPGSPWFVLAKVDRDDALRHARMTAWAVGGGFLAVVGSLGWTVGRYWRGRQRDAELRRQRLEREKSMVEERLGALMRSANDVVLLYNEDMRVVDANERVRDLYGRSPQEMIGLPAHDLRATGSTSGLQADFLAAYSQGGRVYETLHHRRDGTEFPVEVSARPVTLEGRRYLLSIVRDISERRLRDLEIHRLNRMYFVISQVNQAIVHQGSEAELFAEVVRVMVELGEFRLAWIGRVDEATRRIDPVAVAGDEHGYVAGLQVSADPAVPAGQGPTGTAVRENRAVIVNNFFDDPSTMPWRERASRADFLSCASFPVRVEGRVAGVLAVYAAQREFFGAREIALLEEAAGDVGFALRVFARDAERRRAQEALREREEIFSSIVGHAMDAMVVFDQAGRVVEFNRAAHEMLGYTREEFARFSIRDFNAQQDEQEIQGHIGRLMQTGRLEFETLHQHKDGSTRTVQVRASVLQIRGASYISGAWTDITRQKRAEAELRASEERHRALYESMDIGVVYQDAAGAITAANHAAQLILGLTLDQMQGRTSLDADWGTCREDGTAYPGHEHPAMVALRTGMRINGVIMGIRSGAGAGLRWLSVDAVPETRPGEGRPYRVFTLFTDITQRLRTEEEMRQLSAAVEQNPASVVITDLSGAIQYVNPRFTEFTGYSLAEVKGRNPRVLKSGLTPPETYQDLWRTIAGGRVWRGELVNRKKNGEIFTELVVITPVRDAYGNLHRYLALKEDITGRKQMEEHLRASESRYRLIAENTGDIIWLYNLAESRFEYISPSVRRLRGMTVEEAMDNRLTDSLTPESAAEVARTLPARLAAFAAGEPAARELTYQLGFRRKDGSAFPAEVTTTLIGDAQGRPVKMIGVTHDVTEPRRLELALREKEAHLRHILLEVPLAMVLVAPDGRILLRNRSFGRLFGYAEEEVPDVGAWFLLAYPDPDYRERSRRVWDENLRRAAGGRGEIDPGEYRVRTRDGRTVTVEISGVILGGELLVTFTDLTPRRLAEEESRKLMRAVEQSPVSIVITDLQGAIEYANPHFSRITGYTFAEVRGQNPRVLKSGLTPPEVYQEMWATLTAGRVWRGELLNRKKDGGLYTELAVIAPVTEADGVTTHFVAVKEDITERKQTEAALRTSEERYRLIADNTSDAIWIYDLATNLFVYMSPAAERLLGYAPEELVGRSFDVVLPPAALRQVGGNLRERIQALAAGDESARHRLTVVEHRHRDGRAVVGEVVTTLLTDGDGGPTQILGISRDVSERARMARELERRVRELRVMHEVAQVMEKNVVLAAAAFQAIARLLPEMSADPGSTRAELEIHGVVYCAGAAAATGHSISEPILVNERPVGRVTLGLIAGEDGTPEADVLPAAAVLANVARTLGLGLGARESFAAVQRFNLQLEARVAERTAEIEARNREVQALLQSIPDLVVQMRSDGTVVYSKPAREGALAGRVVVDGGPETPSGGGRELRDHLRETGQQALAGGETVPREVTLAADGDTLVLELRAAPVGGGEFVVFVRDITGRKRLEAEVAASLDKERQVSEMKTRFISVTSHGFRTPMAAAVGTLGLLRNHLDRLTPEKRAAMFERIDLSMKRMTDMLDDILLLNRIDTGRLPVVPTPVDLPPYLQGVIDEVHARDEERHEFRLVTEGDGHEVLTDASVLHHILSNLLGNAALYSPLGSTVNVRLRLEPARVRIAIVDQGIGIPEADLPRLFEPFERGSNVGSIAGSGLGLNIVRRLTQLLGGSVQVESRVGRGSRFVLEFPRSQPPPSPPS